MTDFSSRCLTNPSLVRPWLPKEVGWLPGLGNRNYITLPFVGDRSPVGIRECEPTVFGSGVSASPELVDGCTSSDVPIREHAGESSTNADDPRPVGVWECPQHRAGLHGSGDRRGGCRGCGICHSHADDHEGYRDCGQGRIEPSHCSPRFLMLSLTLLPEKILSLREASLLLGKIRRQSLPTSIALIRWI